MAEPEVNMPEHLGHTSRNRSVICRVVLYGTLLLVTAIFALLLISYIFGRNTGVLSSIFLCGAAFIYVVAGFIFLYFKRVIVVAYLIVIFYTLLASGMVAGWGINTPLGILLFGLVIVLAGILLTARHAFFAALASFTVLIGLQTLIMFNWYAPDIAWVGSQSSFGDVAAYGAVFGMLALVSWLYNREMEKSLAQAHDAEAALLAQKATLELRVKERTAELRKAQLEEMQQMYRFAELGRLGVTLLHDLANHLTALTIEIDGIQGVQSATMTRAQKIMQYLADIVYNTRERLRGATQKQTFNMVRKTSDTVDFLNYKAIEAGVKIDWDPPKQSWRYKGDAASFCQVITIITSNAIDANSETLKSNKSSEARVVIKMDRDDSSIIIRISDWGRGFTKNEQKHLFKPFRSTKKTGMGLGLYIAKQTVEMEFSGSLELDAQSDHTEFIIKLPRKNEA